MLLLPLSAHRIIWKKQTLGTRDPQWFDSCFLVSLLFLIITVVPFLYLSNLPKEKKQKQFSRINVRPKDRSRKKRRVIRERAPVKPFLNAPVISFLSSGLFFFVSSSRNLSSTTFPQKLLKRERKRKVEKWKIRRRKEKIPWEGEFTLRSDPWAGLLASSA